MIFCVGERMVRNFIVMPLLLKILTVSIIALPIFFILTLFSGHSINVFGRYVSAHEWWSSGAGFVAVANTSIMLAASLLILKRSAFGRVVYVLGFLMMTLSIPLVTKLLKINGANVSAPFISNLILTVIIGVYLYTSKDIRNYFKEG